MTDTAPRRPVLRRATLDALRCGRPGCTCAEVHLGCTACGGEAFVVGYSRQTGQLTLTCDDCMEVAGAVRVGGDA